MGENLAHTWRLASAIWRRAEPFAPGKSAGNLGKDRPLLVDPKPRHLFQQANPRREPFDELSDVAKALDALGSTAGNPEEDAVKKL